MNNKQRPTWGPYKLHRDGWYRLMTAKEWRKAQWLSRIPEFILGFLGALVVVAVWFILIILIA